MSFKRFEDPELKKKFKQLNSVEQKLDFWLNELKSSYYKFADFDIEYIGAYEIHTDDPDEIQLVNEHILEHVDDHRFQEPNKKLILSEMLDNFKNELHLALSKKDYLEKEIQNIHIKLEGKKSGGWHNFWAEENRIFKQSFDDHYHRGIEIDLRAKIYRGKVLLNMHNGVVLSEYAKYVYEIRDKINLGKQLQFNTPLRSQLAILDHIGVLDNIKKLGPNTKVAELLALLLNGDVHNIRTALSTPNIGLDELKSKDPIKIDSLNKLAEILESLGMDSKAQLIKNELNK